MPIIRGSPDQDGFNPAASFPFQLRTDDFRLAMQDAYDFFHDVNTGLQAKGLERLDDTHGARSQWMCVFVYAVDNVTEPAVDRKPMAFTEVHLGQVDVGDFRSNARGELGTRTATLHANGIAKLRNGWVYRRGVALAAGASTRSAARRGRASQPILK